MNRNELIKLLEQYTVPNFIDCDYKFIAEKIINLSENKTTKNDNVVFFDCDETLILWDVPDNEKANTIKFDNYGLEVHLLPHKKHIELLKQFKARGHHIIVWSQGGWEWATEVVKMLNLDNVVDQILSKPKWYCDDLPAEAFMGQPIYIHLDGKKSPWDVIFNEEDYV